ncbi:hypothetical protein IH879_16090 [candidate division KSB1 bacterium]|nr:hypothetical protein [candidate division KSB1 bacterium]
MPVIKTKINTRSAEFQANVEAMTELVNDVRDKVAIIAQGGGFNYGGLGMSHHAIEDLSILRALPNMTVVAPCSEDEVRGAMQALYALPGPAYLRLDKSKAELGEGIPVFELGKARYVRDGTAATLIACGGILEEALQASEKLAADGIGCRVISMHTLKPLDVEAIQRAAHETGGIISIEENYQKAHITAKAISEFKKTNQEVIT